MLYAIIIGLIVLLILGTVAALLINQENEKRSRILSVVQGSDANLHIKKSRISEQDQRRADLAQKLKEAGEEDGKPNKKANIAELIMQAGFDFSVRKFWIGSVIFAVGVTFVSKFIFGTSLFTTICVAITAFLGIPKLFLKMKAKRRQKKFLEDFSDALEATVRLLKAGMPVTEAISMIAREYTGPIGEEMNRIYDQQKIGVPLPEAVLEGARRIPIPEMQMFGTAVAIQAQTGSSLSDILLSLAAVIRARFRLRRKVEALSSEAKASAMIIGALPILVATGMYFINREYIEVLFIDPTGKFLLGFAVFWMCLGCLVMRQMINFKV